MKKSLNDNLQSVDMSLSIPFFLQSFHQVPLSVAIHKDYRPERYYISTETRLQYMTDEGLKRQRQQQHKMQLEKLRNQRR